MFSILRKEQGERRGSNVMLMQSDVEVSENSKSTVRCEE